MPEKKAKLKSCMDVPKIKKHKKIFVLAMAMFLGALGLVFTTLWADANGKLIYALVSSAILCALAFLLLPPMMAKCNLYMFIVEITYIQISGALEYFYTANDKYVPLHCFPLTLSPLLHTNARGNISTSPECVKFF